MSYLRAQPVNRNQVNVEEIEDGLVREAVHGGLKCSQCSYETNDEKNLQRHLNTHKKPYQCDICKINYSTKNSLRFHIKHNHIENGCEKDYQCSECIYQTNSKTNYQRHLNRHRGIKLFECGICKMKFTKKQTLQMHIKNKHTDNGGVKDYQCTECNYQTNYKQYYQAHLNVHRGTKPFECGICKMKFIQKHALQMHIKNKHTDNGGVKDYQCTECNYQTNYKQHYQAHLNVHRGIKPFECGICKMKFIQKRTVKFHIKNKHGENGCAKDYQCSECTYQTNYKGTYQAHLNRHRGIKAFECGTCKMKFTQKSHLVVHIKKRHTQFAYETNSKEDLLFECDICKMNYSKKKYLKFHIKNKHLENGSAMDYQCSECTYATNSKQNYQRHINGHRGIKPFECGICKTKFTRKDNLKTHIKKKHTE